MKRRRAGCLAPSAERDRSPVFRDCNELSPSSAVRERLAIAGHALLAGVYQDRILHDHGDLAFVRTDRDHRPVFYPLNPENASPFGTTKLYLSCAEIATPAVKRAIDSEILRLIGALFSLLHHPHRFSGG
jgi:hypothetical protein